MQEMNSVQRSSHLRTLLLAFQSDDPDVLLARERMLDLLASAIDPFSREHYAPGHFTASAFVCSRDGSGILLIHHAKLGRWLQPGGHVEPTDSDLLAAARREVAEETSLTELELRTPGIFDLDVHEIPARGASPRHEHFDVRFAFVSKTLEHQAASDALAARWVRWADVPALESDASVMRAVTQLQDLGPTRVG